MAREKTTTNQEQTQRRAKPRKKKRGALALRPRQQRFIAKFADPKSPSFGNGTKSAIEAGYSPISARSTAPEILAKPAIRREVERILDDAGVSREATVKVIRQATKATKRRVFCSVSGGLVYSKAEKDHEIRLKAAEMSHRLRGDFPSQEALERAQLLAIQLNVKIAPRVVKEAIDAARDVEE